MKTLLSDPLYDMSASRAFTTDGALRPIPCHVLPVHRATPPDVPVTPGNEPPTNNCDPALVIDLTTTPVPNWGVKLLNAATVSFVVLKTARWSATPDIPTKLPPR